MKKYTIHVSPRARLDILELENLFTYLYSAPLTAKRYVESLYARIYSLSSFAESIRVSDKQDILRFGINARAISFKKMLIVYTVCDTLVIIEAVIPASLVIK